MEKKNRFVQIAVVEFAFFVLVGTIVSNISGKYGQDGWKLYFTQFGETLKQGNYIKEGYFFYVFRLRMLKAVSLWLLSMTSFGAVCLWAALGWLGFTCGVRISLGTMVFGKRGILYFLCSILPQAVFYIPAILLLGVRGFQIYSFMRKQRSLSQYCRIRMGRDLLLFLILLLCLLPGIICECYMNPLLLKMYF